MKRFDGWIVAVAAAAAVAALGAGPALAKHDGGPPGQAKKEDGGGPPGLAKKGGLPPGQAKKLYGKGQYLPRTYIAPTYYVEPVRYRLPPPPYGSRWVIVDGNAYLVRTETGLIMDVVADLISRR
jgi:Ni/Co efflux regulator RcnB